jgi:hypothetical protein
MLIKWNDTGKIADLVRPDALRAIRRLRATLVEEEETKPKPVAATKPKPPAIDAT